jgi:hypothetical protein
MQLVPLTARASRAARDAGGAGAGAADRGAPTRERAAVGAALHQLDAAAGGIRGAAGGRVQVGAVQAEFSWPINPRELENDISSSSVSLSLSLSHPLSRSLWFKNLRSHSTCTATSRAASAAAHRPGSAPSSQDRMTNASWRRGERPASAAAVAAAAAAGAARWGQLYKLNSVGPIAPKRLVSALEPTK